MGVRQCSKYQNIAIKRRTLIAVCIYERKIWLCLEKQIRTNKDFYKLNLIEKYLENGIFDLKIKK